MIPDGAGSCRLATGKGSCSHALGAARTDHQKQADNVALEITYMMEHTHFVVPGTTPDRKFSGVCSWEI
jgi:hypothetical protein